MASSKTKKPPVLRQRSPEAAEEEGQTSSEPISIEKTSVNRMHDQPLFTAFKKLKVDTEGNCVQRTEDQSQTHLKHKPDVQDVPSPSLCEPVDNTDWSMSLEKFCFCDEGALHKKGRSRLKYMCSFHRQRSLKRDGGRVKNASLVQAWRSHKPLLQESRFSRGDKPNQLLQAARLTLKPSCKKDLHSSTKCHDKQAITGASSSDSNTLSLQSHATGDNPSHHVKGDDPAPHATSDNPSPHATRKSPPPHTTLDKLSPTAAEKSPSSIVSEGKPSPSDSVHGNSSKTLVETPSTSSQPVFAAQASRHLPSFASVQHQSGKAAASSSNKQPNVPHFQGHRSISHHHCMPMLTPGGASQPSLLSLDSHSASSTAAPATPRLELSVERSCSQEARLDESEFSANELAAYLDNFLHLPKEMSSMAQMMYT